MRVNLLRGMLVLFLVATLQALSVSGQSGCEDITECAACTSGLSTAVQNKCVWCLNNDPIPDGKIESLLSKPELRAGSCAATCKDESTGSLGIAETLTTKTTTEGSELESFVGIDTVQENVKLRRGTKASFTVKLTKGPVPFQLYFLLDLSESMTIILNAVKSSASKLPDTFAKDSELIRPEFEFGFGSFIDKPIPPFTYNRLEFSVPTYGFRHEVSFTRTSSDFTSGIAGTTVSGNNDQPEGGLDAVVQALYCNKLLGWRNLDTNALRLILMTTDDTSHVAGDGIEAGLLWPSELKCHPQFFFQDNNLFVSQLMNPLLRSQTRCASATGEKCWYHNVVHDYPSVDQVAQGLRDRKTSLAFVVPGPNDPEYPGRFEHYKDMVDKSLGSSAVVANDALVANPDELDFTKIVRNTYYQLISQEPIFEAIDGGDAEFEDFYKVTSKCEVAKNNPKSVEVDLGNQNKLVIELKWDCKFEVELRGTAGSPKNLTQVQSQGTFGSFKVVVESSNCVCPAPAPVSLYFLSPINTNKCASAGKVSEGQNDDCGECICDAGVTGDLCNCEEEDKFTQCPKADSSGLTCNGVGTCECGKCKCPPPYYGPKCECSDQCDEPIEADRCGGPDAGTCVCETCQCKPGFSGAKCECNNNKCDPPGGGKRCNGRSKTQEVGENIGEGCNCGKCECKEPYSGEFCEICDNVKGAQLFPPVLCGDDGKCGACTRTVFDDAEPDEDTWGCECCFKVDEGDRADGAKSLCQWCSESNQCISRATIEKAVKAQETVCTSGRRKIIENNETIDGGLVYAVKENITQCPPPVPADVTAIVTGTLLGLLALIILALLLWRLLAFLSDKKEWENYEKDKARSKWQADNNPIFKSSVAEFENPIFE